MVLNVIWMLLRLAQVEDRHYAQAYFANQPRKILGPPTLLMRVSMGAAINFEMVGLLVKVYMTCTRCLYSILRMPSRKKSQNGGPDGQIGVFSSAGDALL
jgi:hypothetical protein